MNAVVSSSPTHSDRQLASACHWGAMLAAVLTSWGAGFAGMAVGFIMWLLFKERPLVRQHAAETFNFHLSFFIWVLAASIAVGVIAVLTIGIGLILFIPLWIVAALIWLACGIRGASAALRGQRYEYPLTMRFLS